MGDLDPDRAIEPRAAPAVHFAHPGAQRAEDLVGTQTVSDRESQVFCPVRAAARLLHWLLGDQAPEKELAKRRPHLDARGGSCNGRSIHNSEGPDLGAAPIRANGIGGERKHNAADAVLSAPSPVPVSAGDARRI